MPVHLYGHPAAMDRILPIARQHGLQIVEDAAQDHVASLWNTPVGAFGDAAAFSFYPTKNMTSGEGGMVATSDAETAPADQTAAQPGDGAALPQRGRRLQHAHERCARCHWTSATGQVEWLDRPAAGQRRLPHLGARQRCDTHDRPGGVARLHQYTIRIPGHDQTAFVSALTRKGCGFWGVLPHPSSRITLLGLSLDLPETERASKEVISLPVHPSLTEDDLETIALAVNAVAKAGA